MRRGRLDSAIVVAALLVPVLGGSAPREDAAPFSDEDRGWWAFQPLGDVRPPVVRDPLAARGPVDLFVLARLDAAGLDPAPEADRETLVRRASFDLLGLPPAEDEVDAFLGDDSPDAWERLLDRLLASPRLGERSALRWLDLVRYADSDGFRADGYRPHAWRYRDYVVRSFNADKPYDVFAREQIAGDELGPRDDEGFIATGYLRHWPYEWNQRDVHRQWHDILDDVTDVTGEVFLGISIRCARCHDHKFDPLLRRDYFALQAFFNAILPDRGLVAATASERAEHEAKLEEWRRATSSIRAAIEEIERPHREKLIKDAYDKFSDEIRRLVDARPEELSVYEQQVRHLANRQFQDELPKVAAQIKGEEKKRWEALQKELAAFDHLKPPDLPGAMAVVDIGPRAPATTIPGDGGEVLPAFPAILGSAPPAIEPRRGGAPTTGRRSALARWLTRPENPLATRVIVNRIWQDHFGEGIVPTANDFGRQGEPPTHPALLDWLARELPRRGWSVKAMHRLLMTSRAYRQRSSGVGGAPDADPENRLLWKMRARRLTAEELRDAMLAAGGELDLAIGGPAAGEEAPRRAVYLKVMRNSPAAMMEVFDAPDHFSSCARRNVTTTAPQALLLINGEWTLARARALAARVRARHPEEDAESRRARVAFAWRLAFGRSPAPVEVDEALAFVAAQGPVTAGGADTGSATGGDACPDALVDLCHVFLNANEFLYVD